MIIVNWNQTFHKGIHQKKYQQEIKIKRKQRVKK